MNSKTVPLSVRITHQDAEFLAQLKIEGAKTPSDKLRAIIRERRKQSLEGEEYGHALSSIESYMAPILMILREVQNSEKAHSEIIRIIVDWLPDAMAYLLIHGKPVTTKGDLALLESELADKIFRLLEGILRLGVTDQSPCIDKAAVSNRISTSVELVKIIQDRLETKGA